MLGRVFHGRSAGAALALAIGLGSGCATPAPLLPLPEPTPVPPPTPVVMTASRGGAPPAWVDDIPCSAGSQAFLPALEARVLHRVRPPVGLVPVSVAGDRGAGGLRVKVVLEIDRRGTIRRSAVASSSGIGELDRAVMHAIEEAGCMPAPSRALLDERSGTFKVSLGYIFGRG